MAAKTWMPGPSPGMTECGSANLQALDQPGIDQHAVEAPHLGAAGAWIEQPVATLHDLLLLGETGIERQAGGLLNEQRQIGRVERIERGRDVDRREIDRIDG